APAIIAVIDAVEPVGAFPLPQRISALHAAASVRAAAAACLLATVNRRYPTPDFASLADMHAWSSTLAAFVEEVAALLNATRDLLQQEALAFQAWIDHLDADLTRAARRVRVHAPNAILPDWASDLEDAEARALTALADWADALETLTFDHLHNARQSGLLDHVGRRLVRRLPRLGLLALGVAAGATMLRQHDITPGDLSAAVRHVAPDDVAQRFHDAGRGLGVLPRRALTHVQDAADALDPLQARLRALLDTVQGRHTLTIRDSAMFDALLAELERHGYRADDLRTLLTPADTAAAFPRTVTVQREAPGDR
ncbi:hypothetical protein, partial [Ardenticatena maritima]|uniref:hypothetical protein n=1 Tax=Ardenticatena maritima TaxID=872965 RepID=UPI001364A0FB